MIKNKKGVSAIIAAVIMIALVMAIGGIVWAVINNLVSEQLEEAGSCFEVFDSVSINNKYTCWNSTSNEMLFSVSVSDVELTEVVVAVAGSGTTKSYKLTKTPGPITDLVTFPDRDTDIVAPESNSGLTYITTFFTSAPDSVTVYPVVGKNQCDVSDTLASIDSCILLD